MEEAEDTPPKSGVKDSLSNKVCLIALSIKEAFCASFM
jgi:hypothetical protein